MVNAGRYVAGLAAVDLANQLDAATLASRAMTLLHSLSRAFAVEPGMTFEAWQQRARLAHAMN